MKKSAPCTSPELLTQVRKKPPQTPPRSSQILNHQHLADNAPPNTRIPTCVRKIWGHFGQATTPLNLKIPQTCPQIFFPNALRKIPPPPHYPSNTNLRSPPRRIGQAAPPPPAPPTSSDRKNRPEPPWQSNPGSPKTALAGLPRR